jgi:uncharacterized membrane protein
MTAPHAQEIVDGYLARLARELEGAPPADRAELLSQVGSHIAEARALMADETDSDLLNMLDRLGSPAELARETRERAGGDGVAPPPPPPSSDRRGVGALEVAALVGCVVLLPLGLVLAAASGRWTARQKVTAVVFALAVPVALWIVSGSGGAFGFHPMWLIILLFAPGISPVGVVCAAALALALTRPREAA